MPVSLCVSRCVVVVGIDVWVNDSMIGRSLTDHPVVYHLPIKRHVYFYWLVVGVKVHEFLACLYFVARVGEWMKRKRKKQIRPLIHLRAKMTTSTCRSCDPCSLLQNCVLFMDCDSRTCFQLTQLVPVQPQDRPVGAKSAISNEKRLEMIRRLFNRR